MGDSLYALANELRTVIEGGIVFDEETGEVFFDEDNIEDLAITVAQKVEAVAKYSQNRMALAKAREEAAKAMAESARVLKAESERLNEYALRCVKEIGGKLETPCMTVSVRKCPASVSIVDEDSVPSEYMKTKTTTSVDKAAIKKAIQSGEDVPGACLVQNERLQIR